MLEDRMNILRKVASGEISPEDAEKALKVLDRDYLRANRSWETWVLDIQEYVSPEFYIELESYEKENITLSMVRALVIKHLKQEYRDVVAQYVGEVEDSTMLKMIIHKVSIKYMKELNALGYHLEASQLIKMRIHDVRVSYIKTLLEMGYEQINYNTLVKMNIHGVEIDTLKQFRELEYDISLTDAINAKIHDITPEFARELLKRGISADFHTLKKMRIHNVDHEEITRLQQLGFENIDPETLVKLAIHGVSSAYIKDLKELGMDLSLNRYTNFVIHGISVSYVRALHDLGYDASANDLKKLAVHGVDIPFIEKIIELELEHDLASLVKMKIHDVSADFVEKMMKRFPNIKVETLIKMCIHGVNESFLSMLDAKGLTDLSPEQLIKMKIADVF